MYKIDHTALPTRLQEMSLRIEVYPAEELPDEYIDQLVQKSRQPHVQEFEGHEDTEGRFKSAGAYKAWCSGKKRIMYLLLADRPSGKSDVAGVVWFGQRTNPLAPGYDYTFAIRLYDADEAKDWGGYLGKGLAVPFMKATHDDASKHFPDGWLWLDYVKGNVAAEKTYTKFGYEPIAEEDGRIVMGNKTALAVKDGDE